MMAASVLFSSKEFSSKKDFQFKPRFLKCQDDGSLLLSTPNSGVGGILLPIFNTISIDDDDDGTLEIVHIERSIKDVYQLRLMKSAIKFEAKSEQRKNVLNAVKTGLTAVAANRPKKILAIINPNSGWGKGVQNYDKFVKPILEAAKLETKKIATRSSDHIHEIVKEEDLTAYDTIIAGGGDGTLGHVLTALTRKSMQTAGKAAELDQENPELVKPHLTVATVPVGSGNGTSFCLAMTKDMITIACNIVLGYRIPADIFTVHDMDNNFQMVSAAHLCAGYMSFFQKAAKLEELRWLGPLRYFAMLCLETPTIYIKEIFVKRSPDQVPASPRHSIKISDESTSEDEPLIAKGECVRKIVDGQLLQCPVCIYTPATDAAAADEADSAAAGAAVVSPFAIEREWTRLPEMFTGPKSTVMGINMPVKSQIKIEDTRFQGMHLGSGEGIFFCENEHGARHWAKMILALYKDPMSSPATKEPRFCRTAFAEAKISLRADDGDDNPKINVNVDGEPVVVTNNLYVKVHRGFVNYVGTGPLEGHPWISGVASMCAYRCFMYGGIAFLFTIFVLVLVGIGYLIFYLATL